MSKVKRRIKLIQPRLQLKLVFTFLGMSVLGLVFQCVLFGALLSKLAGDLPQDGALVIESTPGIVLRVALVSFAGLLPLVFAVGVLATFRIAGPLYRIETFLKQVIRGEKPEDCILRRGDELVDFCRVVNEATAPLRWERSADGPKRSVDEAA